MRWFGRAYGAPYEEDCEHVATPIGEPCAWCDEQVKDGDDGVLMWHADHFGVYRPLHYECHMRMITGGLNHLRGSCTCCGGTEPPDPADITRRAAAALALRYWRASAAARHKGPDRK